MIKFSFTIPAWLHWLIPERMKLDHEQRMGITGKASTSLLKGAMTLTSEKQ